MKPDAYMPYYGSDFETATKSFRREVKWSYLAACWHYWKHTHCQGLPDDDESLRLICDCPESDWERTKPMIFGPLFKQDGGLWHQKRTAEIFNEVASSYEKVCKASRLGVIARASSKQPSVQPSVIPMVEPIVNQSESESESESKSQSKSVVGANGSHPASKVCDEEWLKALGTDPTYLGVNIQTEYGKMVRWCEVNRKQPSRRRFVNWLNRSERPMKVESTTTTPKGNGISSAQLMMHNQELIRVMEAIKEVKGQASQDAFGTKIYSEEDRKKLNSLVLRRNDLRAILGVTV